MPYQWVLHRQCIGTYLDSDNPSFDTRATDGLRLVKVLAAPCTRSPDLTPRDLSKTVLVEVADQYTIPDDKRQVTAYLAENLHANVMLIGDIADAQLGFVTDFWSPGAAPLPGKITPALAAVVNTVKKAGITPLKFAGGHGATSDYAPLAALAGT